MSKTMSMGPLFEDSDSNFGGNLSDICKNRHRGNAESEAAFQSIKDRLTEREKEVLAMIDAHKGGLIAEEVADLMHTTVNAISGRCSSLKFKGRIKKVGTRLTRSGNRAAVLVAI